MRVLFFAQLRQVTGTVEVEEPSETQLTQAELWHHLIRKFPGLAPHQSSVRLARNGHYALGDELLEPSDEVALIPPVSGG